ncbi:MAG TPA: hypothetical protein ENK03_02570 [Candidatus Cloacimonetes bacterium]|nr:hypothetical protein [Candidatus Cloacimonadota bacterium]
MKDKITEKKVGCKIFCRQPIKTKILTPEDDIIDIVLSYTEGYRKPGDVIVMSESPVAITQGRAINEKDIKIGFLARILWRGVKKVPYGVGLRSKTSMQCAIDECGVIRIIIASICGAIGKLFGIRGLFYKIAGMQAALIDAAHTSPVPPYEGTVIKGPIHTNEICEEIYTKTGNDAVIMDINDIGGSWVIGKSAGIDAPLLEEIMNDNPQGQQMELTPLCLVWEKKCSD